MESFKLPGAWISYSKMTSSQFGNAACDSTRMDDSLHLGDPHHGLISPPDRRRVFAHVSPDILLPGFVGPGVNTVFFKDHGLFLGNMVFCYWQMMVLRFCDTDVTFIAKGSSIQIMRAISTTRSALDFAVVQGATEIVVQRMELVVHCAILDTLVRFRAK